MFFVIIFLALAAFASYLFPNWSWVTTLLVSFGCVAAFRLILHFTGGPASSSKKDK